jgi:hypothetical protein
VVTAYHDNVNNLFNAKIDLVKENKGSTLSAAKDDNICRTDTNNVTSYCLGVLAIDELNAFQTVLLSRQNEVSIPADESVNYTFENVTIMTSSQADFINQTLDQAEKTLNLALEAYDQFRVAYPMHLKYQDIIKELETYNNKMAELEDYSKLWPGKFINASTTNCT